MENNQTKPEGDGFVASLAVLRPHLFRRARLWAHDDAEADDLVQDTSERALLNRNSFREGTDVKAWTTRIMRNMFIDSWRRAVPRVELDADGFALPVEPESLQPWDVLTAEDVEATLSGLRAGDRELFQLAHLEARSYADIGARLGMNPRTVGTRLHRLRVKMRTALWAAYRRRAPGSAVFQTY